MKTKIILVFSLIIALVLMTNFVFAVPAAPNPTCRIKAEILNASYNLDYLILQLRIIEVSTVQEIGRSCDEVYTINREVSVFTDNVIKNVSYSEGGIIEGNVHFEGDEFSHGFYLTNYSLINQKLEPEQNIFQRIINWFKNFFLKK